MPHVVIVEDDKMNARLFQVVLERRGDLQVTVTEDAAELFRLVNEQTVDLIIMDVSLATSHYEGKPIDGLQITRKIKDNPLTSDVPVILATAHAMRGDRERFLSESKADEYIAKPILDQAGLVEKVKSLIMKRKSARG